MPTPDPVWPAYAQAEIALQRVEHDLAATPDTSLLLQRARLLNRLARPDAARQAYLDVLARDFRHEAALLELGALLFTQHYTSAARTVFEQAIAVNPDNLAARVRLGNLLRLAEEPTLALAEYQAALVIAPDCREAHQGLAYLLDEINPAQADHHRNRGFAGSGVITTPYRGQSTPIAVLCLVSAQGGNIPLAEVLDDRLFLTHSLVAEFAAPDLALPAHDIVLNAIGDADRCAPALRLLPRFLSRTAAPLLNHPERVLATSRLATPRTLAQLPGVIGPRCVEIPRAALAQGAPPGFSVPFLLRSPGFHTGLHFRKIGDISDLARALADLPGDTLYAIDDIDTRAADGLFRKYRVMLIGGALLPLHLAISHDWKVHYFTADMARSDAFRREEARFLGDMPAVIGAPGLAALRTIQAKLGLDYAGIDFALAPDGRIVVFEANATMTIVSPPADPIWAYRRPAAQRAIDAAQALIRSRARQE